MKCLIFHFPDDNAKSMDLLHLNTETVLLCWKHLKIQKLKYCIMDQIVRPTNSNCIHENPFQDYCWKYLNGNSKCYITSTTTTLKIAKTCL
jgi:hypothetical protein